MAQRRALRSQRALVYHLSLGAVSDTPLSQDAPCALEGFTSLTGLHVLKSPNVVQIQTVGTLTNLVQLSFGLGRTESTLESIASLTKLRNLYIDR